MNYASKGDCVAIGTQQDDLYLTDRTCRSLRIVHLRDNWLMVSCLIPGDTLSMFIADEKGDILSCDDICSNPQMHTKSVRAIYCTEFFLFTSSLDGILKVWDLFSQKQLGQFHMPVPISAVCVHYSGRELLRTADNIHIVCGTASGHVHLLLWKTIVE
ncbi:uncharacterized protein LOC143223260 [Tachypleus tridentatus]|uniref:uncharacterized protein LOC143223260 n=1 Tax=Tachypleus tridentatus TaxID=6853 RepID=UPI003FD56EA9